MTIDVPKRSRMPALRALWQEAFGDTEEFLNAFEKTAFAIDRCRCVTIGETVVAALYWFDCSCRDHRIAYLYAIATAKAFRGRGICTELMEDTHKHLKALGYEGAILVPGSETLFDFYQKIGYRICSHVTEFSCSASTHSMDLRQIDKSEYARLRRQLLPNGGVIQENENLEFLHTMANFYVGEDFLLAARWEADVLYGAELLGDATAAHGIVRALGCREGRFRMPGDHIPFAMYFPLGDETLAPPAYFGLAFD